MEKLDIKKVRCQAKVLGTLVTVAGAMFMTLYKGPIVEMVWSKYVHPRESYVTNTTGATDKDWLKGCILLIMATLAWASFFILQVNKTEQKKKTNFSNLRKKNLILFIWVGFSFHGTFIWFSFHYILK